MYWSNFLLPIVAGILIGTSYIPFPPWALFFCLTPLFYFWSQDHSLRKNLQGTWITQFLLTLIGFHWVAHVAHEFGRLPWLLSIPIMLAFCCFASLHFVLAAAVCSWSKLRLRSSCVDPVFIGALALGFFEIVYPMIFNWNLGYPWLWARLPGFQWADYIGFQGLSFLTILINYFLYRGFRLRHTLKGKVTIAGTIGFLLFFNLSSYMREFELGEKKFNAVIVQANIGNADKYYAEFKREFRRPILQKYFELSSRALEGSTGPVDVLVWPETAYPDDLNQNSINYGLGRALRDFLQEKSVGLLTGAYNENPENRKAQNILAALNSAGELVGESYVKTHLLAFGEYFPGGDTFPFLKEIVPAISDFDHGRGPQVLDYNGILLGPQICYEGLFPDFSSKIADLGAQIFVNVTNDSWFGTHFEPYQHLYMTLARAIEFRRPLIRSTNTGISSAILADGTILQGTPLHQEAYIKYEVPFSEKPQATFYQRFGRGLPWLILFILIGSILYGINKPRRN